jgi:purine-binding chemotaxis protein CheW
MRIQKAPDEPDQLKLNVARTLLQDALTRQVVAAHTGKKEELEYEGEPGQHNDSSSPEHRPEAGGSDVRVHSQRVFPRPDWAHGGIQTLIFRLGALKLAVPLVKLGGIHKMTEPPRPLVGQPGWFKGLMMSPVGQLAVVDTALWMMPERYQEALSRGLRYDHVVVMDDSCWGLACSGVENARTVHEEDVQWSDIRHRRPWMAGILKEEMCALIDVDVLVAMLNTGSRPFVHES